jgi:hypothetical protein
LKREQPRTLTGGIGIVVREKADAGIERDRFGVLISPKGIDWIGGRGGIRAQIHHFPNQSYAIFASIQAYSQ